MSATTRLKLMYLLRFSKPAGDRMVYQTIHQQKIESILELGIGNGQRSVKMLELAAEHGPAESLRYIGVDEFEGGSSIKGDRITLKEAHRLLHATGSRIRLVPGDPLTALQRNANSLGKVDVVVVSASVNAEAMARAWFFLPRMLQEGSLTFVEDPKSREGMRQLGLAEVAELAEAARHRRAA